MRITAVPGHPSETLAMDRPYPPQTSIQHHYRQYPTPRSLKGRGREGDPQTPGAEIWMQTQSRWARHGDSRRDSPRTWVPGGSWLAAYVPDGTAWRAWWWMMMMYNCRKCLFISAYKIIGPTTSKLANIVYRSARRWSFFCSNWRQNKWFYNHISSEHPTSFVGKVSNKFTYLLTYMISFSCLFFLVCI